MRQLVLEDLASAPFETKDGQVRLPGRWSLSVAIARSNTIVGLTSVTALIAHLHKKPERSDDSSDYVGENEDWIVP
jgi:hypothetical protein